ncbi:MAG: YeaH/YhbH family protein [Burkholderiales bacterium]
MQQIVDRRLSGKNKSIGNRERFLRRYREQIRDAVRKAVSGRGIRDIEQGEDITLPRRDVSEPVFGHGQGGVRESVHPGNRDYVRGDRIGRPQGGGGGGAGGSGSPDGGGDDDFVFRITREEFMQIFFDDLALPHLVRTQLLPDAPEWRTQRTGFVSSGNPASLHIVRSLRTALGRRIAMGGEPLRLLHALQEELMHAERSTDTPRTVLRALQERVEALQRKVRRIPFLDPLDLRFRNRVRVPLPTYKAVMFCLMDVSGSMDESRKDLAKRFFMLLYLFLKRNYERIDVVFIRHHTVAKEVDEEDFFHSRESGGTVVSSALKLMVEVIHDRYPPSQWNIYCAQASDGDNWAGDSELCGRLLRDSILPLVQYYAYVEVASEEPQNLWEEYLTVKGQFDHFAMQRIIGADEIYPVLHDLFQKRAA